MRIQAFILSVLSGALMVGCSTSTSTIHYDLNAAAASPVQTNNVDNSFIQYRLASVIIPEQIDITSLVVRQANDSLLVLSHDRWVGSLNQVMQAALSATLTEELGMPPLPGSMTTITSTDGVADLIVDVRQFEMQPAKQATLGALWQVNFQNVPRASITCYSLLGQPVVPGVEALVSAQQVNVQQLGKQIAAAIRTGQVPVSGKCQIGKA